MRGGAVACEFDGVGKEVEKRLMKQAWIDAAIGERIERELELAIGLVFGGLGKGLASELFHRDD